MTSTYSPSLRLDLQAGGDNYLSWGDVANGDFTMLDAAIAGMSSITVPDADVTLTANNGATDQARSMILTVTGAITAIRNLIIPAVTKVYIINNSTTGGFQLGIKTAAGTQALIDASARAIVYCDGTNCFVANASTFVKLSGDTMTGALTAPSFNTTVGNFTATGATSILAATGAGTVFLRPAGPASTTGQITFTSAAASVYSGNSIEIKPLVSSDAAFFLSKFASGRNSYIYGRTANSARWSMALGNNTAESANSGSDFDLHRYNDSAVDQGSVLFFSRLTGLGTVAGDPTAALGIATKQYADTKAPASGSANYVAKAGDTMSGNLTAPGLAATSFIASNGTITSDNNSVAGTDARFRMTTRGTGDGSPTMEFLTKSPDMWTSLGAAGTKGWIITTRSDAYSATGQQNDFFYSYFDGTGWNPAISIDAPTRTVTMGGPVVLPADPASALQAATKQYVDTKATILSGTASPAAGLGVVGNYYLDADDHILYGPKAAGGIDSLTFGPIVAQAVAQYTLGSKYRFATAGSIIALQIYILPGETVLSGWSAQVFDNATQASLVNKAFATVTPGQWNQVALDTPLAVISGKTYMVAVSVPAGATFCSGAGSLAPITSGNISLLAQGVDGNTGHYGGISSPPVYPGTPWTELGPASPVFSVDTSNIWPTAVSGFPEAPNDGQTYGRKNLAWAAVTGGGGGGIPEPSSGFNLRQNGAWVPGVRLAGDTMTGNLSISVPSGEAAITVNKKTSGTGAHLFGLTNGLNRWELNLGNNAAESGANAGSDFTLTNYDDAGNWLSAPFSIERKTGKATFNFAVQHWDKVFLNADPASALEAATKQYVDNADNLKAPLASPTFTGVPAAPTAATATNTTQIATTAFVKAQGYLTSAVTSVTGSAPVVSSGGNTPAISMAAATTSVDGYLTAANWTTFNNKEPPITGGTTAQYWRGDKTFQTLNAAAVGLGNVSNTAQVTAVSGTAPVVSSGGTTPAISMAAATTSVNGYLTSTDWNTFNGKANLASPTFTGTPTLPTGTIGVTQTAGNNSTALATTAFVATSFAPLASPTFTGTPTLPTGSIGVTQTAGNSTTALATTAFVTTADNLKANLASPTFTGTPAAPTPVSTDNSTTIATTAFVKTAIAGGVTTNVVANVSDTAPGSPVNGQLWWCSADTNLYIYYNDGNSSQWVQVNVAGS